MKETSFFDVLLVDFGSQLTGLIARFLDEQKVRFLRCSLKKALSVMKTQQGRVRCLLLSGGPDGVCDTSPHVEDVASLLRYERPTLGICYGQQVMCRALGGEVAFEGKQEFGAASMHITDDALWEKLFHPQKPTILPVWMSHADHVKTLPRHFRVIGHTKQAPYAAIADRKRSFYGLQFHPEAHHTLHGRTILANFLTTIGGIQTHGKSLWSPQEWVKKTIASLQETWREKGMILCALSGGTDSAVAAALVRKALGAQKMTCLFINTGLMRQGEQEEVVRHARCFLGKSSRFFRVVDASELFFQRLKKITNPEKKRRIIGKAFIDCLEQHGQGYEMLLQGTIASDVVESATDVVGQQVIKSHHNVGALPSKMRFSLMEPLRDLFKDQVRMVGEVLDVPRFFLRRHPFPGPGLAIRIPGGVTKRKVAMLQKADAIFLEELKKSAYGRKVWQGFAVLLSVRSVGVMGDRRTFGYTCVLRAVSSVDAMTARCSQLPVSFLCRVATRIVNEVQGINRVLYDITSKPPACIEWE